MTELLIGGEGRERRASGSAGRGSLAGILRRDATLRRWLAVSDLAAWGATLLVVTKVMVDDHWHWTVAVALAAIVPMAKATGLYDRDERLLRKSTLDEGAAILRVAAFYALIVCLLAPLVMTQRLERSQIMALWLAGTGLMLAFRLATRVAVLSSHPGERCLVVGKQGTCERIAAKLDGSRGIAATATVSLPFSDAEQETTEMDRLVADGGLSRLVAMHDIHRLVIAPHHSDAEHILGLVHKANDLGLHVSIVPRMLEVVGSSVEFDDLNGLTVMGVQPFGLGRSSRMMKRSMDLVGSIAILALASPLMALIALLIKLDSKGPVLFAQRRVGQDGKKFWMVKFRTMFDGAHGQRAELAELNEADGLFKIANDPRITRVGRILRRLSLDELPQLFNVVLGQMSLVGPRPLVVDEDERIRGYYRQRLTLTPGMTGRWQVLGSARIPLAEMVKLDYLYVANWSLWNDVKILLRTIPYVLGRGGM